MILILALAWLLVAAGTLRADISVDGLVPLQAYSALALLALFSMLLLFAAMFAATACWMGCKRLFVRLRA